MRIIFLLAVLVACAAAWSCDGHSLTAAVAYQVVSDDVHSFFSPAFTTALDPYNGPFPGITRSDETFLACSPDDSYIRDSDELKQQYPGIDSFHYMDKCISDDHSCPNDAGKGLLDKELQKVKKTLIDAGKANTLDSTDAAFAFTFLIHLVGDAHQPLHTCTYFNRNTFPEGDRGGNNFCTDSAQRRNKCRNNLHYWFDRIGLFKLGSANVNDVARQWISAYPPTAQQASNVDMTAGPNGWLGKESDDNCRSAHVDPRTNKFIVSGQELSSSYQTFWQRKLKRQVVLGGYRLAAVLTQIYNTVRRGGSGASSSSGGEF